MISITDDEVQSALDYLRDSAARMGLAAANQAKASAMLRHTKALAMKASDENAISAQERDAYASPQYKTAIENEFEAVKEFATLRATREAAAAKLDCWRSSSANNRAARI